MNHRAFKEVVEAASFTANGSDTGVSQPPTWVQRIVRPISMASLRGQGANPQFSLMARPSVSPITATFFEVIYSHAFLLTV